VSYNVTKRILTVVAAISLGSSAFASTNSCQTSNTNSIAVAGSQIAGVAIARAGAASPNADDFATLNGAAVPGCSTVDLTFNNFSVTGTGTSTGGTYISTTTNQNLATGAVTAIFSTVRGADNNATNGNNNDSTQNWLGSQPTATTYTTNYELTSSDVVVRYFFLSLQGVQLGTGTSAGTITGTVSLCLGANWSGSSCSGTTQTVTLTSGTNYYSIALTNPSTIIGIQNSFILKDGNGTGNAGSTFITAFDETFAMSPEPSTLVLMASALLGLAFVRRLPRFKNKQS
jgi:hypothetical protein